MSDRPQPSLWVMPVWVTVASLVLFIALSFIAAGTRTIPGDEAIFDAIQKVPNQPGRTLADIGNIFGTTPATPLVVLILGGYSARRRSSQAVVLCVSAGLLRLSGMFLKRLFDSPRPTVEFGAIRANFDNYGFPSGHAFTAGIVAGVTTIVLLHLLPSTRARNSILILVWVWAALCCYARIWYGAHWPTDIVGGLLAAAFAVGVSTHLARLPVPLLNRSA